MRETSQTSTFVKRLLTEEPFAYFCTTDERNNPHVVPVFFLFDQNRCHAHFLFSKDSKKVRNLRSRPKISFAVDVRDHVNPTENKGVMVHGIAKAVQTQDHSTEMERIKQLFDEKYGWSRSGSFFRYRLDERILVDVAVRKISCWQGPTFLSCPKFCVASTGRGFPCISAQRNSEQ